MEDSVCPMENWTTKCDCPEDTAGANCEKVLTCEADSCGANAHCFVQNHQINCACDLGYSGNAITGCDLATKRICFSGDPHYNTFDGATFDYMATCPYMFSLPCSGGLDNGYSFYSVKAKNDVQYVGATVSVVSSAQVEFYNKTIYVDQYQNIFVDDIQVHAPYYYPSQSSVQFTISYTNPYVVVKNDQFVQVEFTYGTLCLTIPDVPEFRGAQTLCGLAGNLDGNCADDIVSHDGTVAPISNCRPTQAQTDKFGDSWRTTEYTLPDPAPACLDGETMTNKSSTCTEIQAAAAQCQDIFNAQTGTGTFAHCQFLGNDVIEQAYDSCIYDVCLDGNLRCDAFTTFVHNCQYAMGGVNVTGWRDETDCPMRCGAHAEYTDCVSACPATCSDHDAPEQCNYPCAEGCECDWGYVLDTTNLADGPQCIKIEDCGCTDDDGNLHPADQHWLTGDCSQENYCSNGTYFKEPYVCTSNSKCTVANGELTCLCDSGYQYNETTGACDDIDECLDPESCSAGEGFGKCTNTPGSYYCTCKQYYVGHDCETFAPRRHCADLYKYHGVTEDGAYVVTIPVDDVDEYTTSSEPIQESTTTEDRQSTALTARKLQLKQFAAWDDSSSITPFDEFTTASGNERDILVYCDMTRGGGGWTLIANALSNETANKTLAQYAEGFGSAENANLWMGLDLISLYTNYQPMSLRLDIYRCAHNGFPESWTDCTYRLFSVSDRNDDYRVTIPEVCRGTENTYYNGWARWDLSKPGPKFRAYDNDDSLAHCSESFRNTGFWFDTSNRCGSANLNGVRFACDNIPPAWDAQSYIFWNGDPINQADMYIRPQAFPDND
ncbi:hypothetical protein PMAYCL1PPCAC_03467 [Pristionchus mayeri]|uniref:Uncharacterized protein n=1 Tax=Pristionchus mayeri TaxID=1317129 RepID=A0AAN5C7Z8_9BILA|nr:hypothetical protein PMAYCL1PPCAC_03467 [Pristionchus mayeri]